MQCSRATRIRIANITSREGIPSEKSLFDAHAGDYAAAPDAIALLATRTEGILSNERTFWAKTERTKEDSSD